MDKLHRYVMCYSQAEGDWCVVYATCYADAIAKWEDGKYELEDEN